MKAFVAAMAAIILITLASVVVLQATRTTSAEAGSGVNVRLN